tara:strand:+ start:1208 stop:1594 length:387 start_codon:yes stop_codon:yes gene_type:complete
MKLKWTVVDPHSGLKEDAPANMAGGGNIAGIGVGPQGEPGIRKKKKREDESVLMTRDGVKFDARTKAYKEHRAKLEAARQKRENSKSDSRFIEGLKKKTQEMSYGPAIGTAKPMADLNAPRGGKKKKK